MFPGFNLLEKLFIFGLDFFISNQKKKSELKQSFDNFFKKSSSDSKVSSKLRGEYKKMRNGKWVKKETSEK